MGVTHGIPATGVLKVVNITESVAGLISVDRISDGGLVLERARTNIVFLFRLEPFGGGRDRSALSMQDRRTLADWALWAPSRRIVEAFSLGSSWAGGP